MSDNEEAKRDARARYRQYNFEAGLCVKCPASRSEWSALYCDRHADKQRAYARKCMRRRRARAERQRDLAILRKLRAKKGGTSAGVR